MGTMIKRYLLIHLRDRTSVFFSLLSVFVTVGLYILFLAELQADSIRSIFGGFVSENVISEIVHTWTISGLLAIIPATSALGALGHLPYDRESGRVRDYIVSPQNSLYYPVAAMFSGALVAVIMSLFAFGIYSIYMYVDCGIYYSITEYLQIAAIVLLGAILSAATMAFAVSFLRGTPAFSAFSIFFGTLIGFFTGIYVPVGILPSAVQYAVKLFPFSHIATLLRSVMMEESMNKLLSTTLPENFEGADLLLVYKELYGVEFTLGEHVVSQTESIIFISAVAITGCILFFINYKRKKTTV